MQGIVGGYRVAAFLTPRDLVVESIAADLIESGYDGALGERAARSLLQPWIVSCNMNGKNRTQAAFVSDWGRTTATR
jgi:hypothetical protein